MPDLTQQGKSRGRVLGFDYGSLRIGIAVGNSITGTAGALDIIHNRRHTPNWPEILAIIHAWKPEILVVGLPLSSSGEETEMSAEARAFAKKLGNKSSLAYLMVDERYSTHEANRVVAGLARDNIRKHWASNEKDDVAAQIILETYFADTQSSTSGSTWVIPPALPSTV